ncbi:benzoate degradation ring-cleavage hydrolase [Castellaniella defragrans 65Phen]|uniref:Benzoate degradation ring-cleavage hydrolase n=2 Tax=Castellaniella defragrans TaxID=75697 RepID=W8X5R0_CASD6|nr:alpha/beta hydrolase [Castellaniella defragrans]KAB0609126.1 alpha/beta hydrolase [Castellaniella defragrans]MBB6083255.1 pimeloyl-ACP methyl ester carboxylesterase [Castellaniella defragrans]CDM25401.1 benzoate degradation ring-cleavage hydrolase [Castellaniella defragrans 65Phen]
MSPAPAPGAPGFQAIRFQGRALDIEYRIIPAARPDAEWLVFLHEGLGSLSMWKDWPERLCAAVQCRGLVYSRAGYGASTPRAPGERWPVEFMHRQADEALPALLDALGLGAEKPILFGHSDGASIALLHAALHPGRVRAVAVAAPHIFVEDVTLASIERARAAYLHTDLPHRLGRYHQDPDSAFWGWNDVWLDPAFRDWNIEPALADIRCPVLAIQGRDDEYGTLKQIYGIRRKLPQTELCIIEQCGHSPHKDQPAAVLEAMAAFVGRLRDSRG